VHISLTRFNRTSFDSTTGTAKVGTGQLGEEVYQALEPFNVSIAAGRVSGVGVGGFTLGGGYSWTTNQVGVSCDTVVEFEVALPTGKVVTATNTSNADLFFGLKGGGNNFGIVTAITYKAIEQPAVWGGLVIVNGDGNITTLSKEISDFQDTNADPKAVIGVAYNFDPSLGGKGFYLLIIEGPNLIYDIRQVSSFPSSITIMDHLLHLEPSIVFSPFHLLHRHLALPLLPDWSLLFRAEFRAHPGCCGAQFQLITIPSLSYKRSPHK